MLNFCIISGSARAENNTFRVALAINHKLESLGYQTSLVDFRAYDIPLINQGDIIPEQFTPFQQLLTESMHLANCIIIITPEYNWSTTPEILNWLHRFGDKRFKHLFENKVFATVGVSTGKGGKAPALHLHSILNKIISFTDLDSIVSAKIFESHFTKEVLDTEGNSLNNAMYDAGLNDFAHYTARITNRWIGFKAF
ncbi:MAG: NADPH-dependent oxidoreductase [Bacteroidetes bacterium]|nr:MAG: NADPH-dependent oxidoreductase [Bacteroidota bacterium]